jgi:hypothetical protein
VNICERKRGICLQKVYHATMIDRVGGDIEIRGTEVRSALAALGVIFALMAVPAMAESAGTAITEFGLVGSWSNDCKLLPADACMRPGDTDFRCGLRTVFEVPVFGSPTMTLVSSSYTRGGPSPRNTMKIEDAVRVSDDKIKISYIGENFRGTEPDSNIEYHGENWIMIVQKVDGKMLITDQQREDAQKIVVQGGFTMMRPRPRSDGSLSPFRKLGPVGAMEKCLN